jgi:hypothetical protein
MNIEQPTSNPDFIGKDRTRRRVLVPCLLGALAMGILLCASNAGAQPTNSSSSSPDSNSFKIITQRNIFDPNRSGIGRIRPLRDNNRRPSVVDAFALVGTMSYEKGKFAFFDGESSQYKKVLEPGAIIAGYTVKDIAPKAVTLAANGKEFQMQVGTQLKNAGANGWRLSTRDVPADSSNSDQGDQTVEAQPTAPPAASSAQASEILKRLMEKRQQELK